MKKTAWDLLVKLNDGNDVIICPYCLKPLTRGQATIDHKRPRARGGKSTAQNKVICCYDCNQEKGSLTTREYDFWKTLESLRKNGDSGKYAGHLKTKIFMLLIHTICATLKKKK
ncbi:MAG: HNH endonuclease [Rickettsiales bacterium]|jgi:5-methylcytosine-specific restriction endonuclease McrA|nr:HNH endonuclease [Rickettsiales bacterium]